MTNRIVGFSDDFLRRVARLSKKHRRIDDDVEKFVTLLGNGETPGDKLQGVETYAVYKARVASSDMQRGKSGGFRIIYYLHTATHALLLMIYAKTEQDNLPSSKVLRIIQELDDESENSSDQAPPLFE